METILDPSDDFDFTQLSLEQPKGIQGGSYFSKILCNNKPFYLQTPECKTKDGIIHNGKKYYCDLLFTQENESFLNWLETLETTLKKLIFSKRFLWFEETLDEDDIDTAFTSLSRLYKSGKYCLIRCHAIKEYSISNKLDIKIYDENENIVNENDITPDSNIISILEINGIKFSSRNFQVDIGIKQIMLLTKEPIFNTCLIKNNDRQNNHKQNKVTNEPLKKDDVQNIPVNNDTTGKISLINDDVDKADKDDGVVDNYVNDNGVNTNNVKYNSVTDNNITNRANNETDENSRLDNFTHDICVKNTQHIVANELNNITNTLKNDNKNSEFQSSKIDSLEEVNLDMENNEDECFMELKDKDEIYTTLYKNAKKKAHDAKKTALSAYLEAKNIKRQYLLDNDNNSEMSEMSEMSEITELYE